MVRLSLLLTLLLPALAAPASAMVRLPEFRRRVEGNPADRLLSLPIEGSSYDGAHRCTTKASRPGMLLAPDAAGNPQALARRMGVEELIWEGGHWGAGTTRFSPCSPCYGKRGKLKRNVDVTTARRDHVHIGMTRRGAAARTSFWSRGC